MSFRDDLGRFTKKNKTNWRSKKVIEGHEYCQSLSSSVVTPREIDSKYCNDVWKEGRRLVEWSVVLNNLSYCKNCRLGPVPLTLQSLKGELQKGLGGYIYVQCQNLDCGYVNCVPYGKTYHERSSKGQGMPCFVVNTKLGVAMVDSLGGPSRVNNVLSTLNLKTVNDKNLKKMEKRAGDVVEAVAADSTRVAAEEAFQNEMEAVACQESLEAQANMAGIIEDLGVCPLPDASPSLMLSLQGVSENDGWTDEEDELHIDHGNSNSTPTGTKRRRHKLPVDSRTLTRKSPIQRQRKSKVKLATRYPCRNRSGMSAAVDTAWHKRGFDSLTSHTFFMSTGKSSKLKKVIKTVVGHRKCGVCSWWWKKRPGQKVRQHQCVRNHFGSARAMEATSGVQGVRELMQEGTPIEYLEGDGDNTLISKIRTDLNVTLKKRFDKNHIVKNFTKGLYKLKMEKGVKLSKTVILHLEKCLKYAFSKNQGDTEGMKENIRAIVPHQFGDHSLCNGHFCGYKRRPNQGEKYLHRSLPYKAPLKDDDLQQKLQKIFDPIISNAHQYIDLGSSQQCEHANKEVTLRAPKSHHYGNSRSLDYRVHATAAFVNEGRHYISKGYSKLGLSPGIHTTKYAEKCMKRRQDKQEKSDLPSTKRRRLVLKQERATIQGANEVLEGDTYQSGIGHVDSVDVEKVPDAISRPVFKPVGVTGEATVVTFDLETTGLIVERVMPHITQIAAVELKSGEQFNAYVTPKVPVNPESSAVTGISMVNGEMKVNGNVVQSISITCAIDKMKSWLEKFKNVCLVAHNGRRFDFPILMSTLKNTGSDSHLPACAFIDSLSVFRKLYPKQSLKQVDLVTSLLGETYDAHNAMADVVALGKLLMFTKLSQKDLMAHSFLPSAVVNNMVYNDAKAENRRTLNPLIYSGVCKQPTADNIAGSGLSLAHLRMVFRRGGEDGLRDVFTAKNCDGLPRVTNSKKVLEEVIPKLVQYFETH